VRARPLRASQTPHQYGNSLPMVPMHIFQEPCPAPFLHRKPLPSSAATSAPLQPPPQSLNNQVRKSRRCARPALCRPLPSPALTKFILQLAVSTLLNTSVFCVVCKAFLPSGAIVFTVGGTPGVPAVITTFFYSDVFTCVACGVWSGLLIGFITEYYTSYSYRPVRDVAESCRTGAATNIIYCLALGMQFTIVPVLAHRFRCLRIPRPLLRTHRAC